jgi:uncharacterized protein (DUF58 family)
MSMNVLPGRRAIVLLGGIAAVVLAALLAGVPLPVANWATVVAVAALAGAAALDYLASAAAWRRAGVRMTRRLPAAFAVGVRATVRLSLEADGSHRWQCALYDFVDPTLGSEGLPMTLQIAGGTQLDASYTVVPTMRGEVRFSPAEVRVRSRWGLCELRRRLGAAEGRRVYPDFSQVARYAWLAGDRRLQEIGIKMVQQRGEGTDFKQLAEYRVGDPVRHLDWRATLRLGKPIVRQFQDERDQYVMLLIDCGRRMRADESAGAIGTSHFDQVLNAVMLLSYVALSEGDAVGAATFGTPSGQARSFAPHKGRHALNALIGQLYDVQPTLTHSDYLAAAADLLRAHHKRALVVVITNFRDEDSSELGHALRLLGSRHLVLLASLRERVVRELIEQPITSGAAAVEIASAHLYEQARRDAFNRLSSKHGLVVDAEPDRLGIELVNRYRAVKRAGLL